MRLIDADALRDTARRVMDGWILAGGISTGEMFDAIDATTTITCATCGFSRDNNTMTPTIYCHHERIGRSLSPDFGCAYWREREEA